MHQHHSFLQSLNVHITARHSSSFPELALPTLLQSAALVSVGLLYEGSAHPLTMNNFLVDVPTRFIGVLKILMQAQPELAMTVDVSKTTMLHISAVQGNIDVMNYLKNIESSLVCEK
ncbi:putative anaphase-promoting complex subunit 1 [Helianthus anomalus]